MTEQFHSNVPDWRGRVLGLNALFLAIWIFLLFFGRGAMFNDPGTFWHVAAGEKMLDAGSVVREDPFSFTRAGRPWVADQWLAECVMAAVYRLAGLDGLLLLTAALLAGFYTWIASRMIRGGLHPLPAALLLMLFMLAGAGQFLVRPLVLTVVMLGITFALLVDVESDAKRPRQLWWLVPLFIVWTNIHGGVLGGLGTVAICAVGWLIIGKETACRFRSFRGAIFLFLLLTALAATTLANPYGLDLPRQWFDTLLMPLPGLIKEHAPLDGTSPIGWATTALAACYVVVLFSVFPRRPRVTWLIPLVWFVLALGRCRNGPLFAITAMLALADMLPYSRLGEWLRGRDMLSDVRPSVGWRAAVLPLILVVTALAVQIGGVNMPLVGRGWVRLDNSRWPVELLPQLYAIEPGEENVPIFNDMNFGGFLIHETPRLRVFVDDRCSLYGAEFLREYDLAKQKEPEKLDRWQQEYGFRYALVEADEPFDQYLRNSVDWTELGRSPCAALYQRRLGEPRPAR